MRFLYETFRNLILSLLEFFKRVGKAILYFTLGLILFIVLPLEVLGVIFVLLAALVIFMAVYVVEIDNGNND